MIKNFLEKNRWLKLKEFEETRYRLENSDYFSNKKIYEALFSQALESGSFNSSDIAQEVQFKSSISRKLQKFDTAKLCV